MTVTRVVVAIIAVSGCTSRRPMSSTSSASMSAAMPGLSAAKVRLRTSEDDGDAEDGGGKGAPAARLLS